jgi:hypothetical protein
MKQTELAVLGALCVLAIVGLVLMVNSASTAFVARERGVYARAAVGVAQYGGNVYDDVLKEDVGYQRLLRQSELAEQGRRVQVGSYMQRGYDSAWRAYNPGLQGSAEVERQLGMYVYYD